MIQTIERVTSADGEAYAELQRETWTWHNGREVEAWRVVEVDDAPAWPGANCYHTSEHDDEGRARRQYEWAVNRIRG